MVNSLARVTEGRSLNLVLEGGTGILLRALLSEKKKEVNFYWNLAKKGHHSQTQGITSTAVGAMG